VTNRLAKADQAQHIFSHLLFISSTMYLSVDATRKHLLMLLNIKNAEHFSMKRADAEVKAHFGSYPLEMAEIWYDLCHFDQLPTVLRFKKREKSMKGFKQEVPAFLLT
jgi:hypothetical protein